MSGMLKVSKDHFELQHLQHASTYIGFGMVWLESVSFSKLFQIENHLNIKKVMSKICMSFVLTPSTYVALQLTLCALNMTLIKQT